jgi:hypothetical protein
MKIEYDNKEIFYLVEKVEKGEVRYLYILYEKM